MQHLPPGYVRVLEKIDEIGRAIYGNAWCGDQVAERRERLAAIPHLPIRSLPPPMTPLGQGSSSGSGGRDYKVDRSPPSAEQLARNAQEREAAQQAVNEAVAQRDGATDELMKRLWRAADIAYQLLPDGSLSAFPNNWAYGDAANTAFFTGESEGGRPVLVADGDAPRTDASTATPQPATVTPELTNTCDDGALPQQPAVEAVTPVAVPIDDPVDRYPPWQDPLKDVLSPSAKSSTTSPPMY